MIRIVAYHSSNDETLEPRRLLHVGTRAQARMRAGTHLHEVVAEAPERMPRLRDHGDWRRTALMRHARRHRVAVYLNRHEGIPLEEFDAARLAIDLDRVADRDFRRHLPSAADSWIILDPSAIVRVTRFE